MHPLSPPGTPSRRPAAWIGAAAITAAIAAASPRVAAAGGIGLRYDAFGEMSYAVVGLGPDGHGPDIGLKLQLGAGGAVAVRFGRYFDLGLGLRYNYAWDDNDVMHLGTAPATAALVIPLGPTRELRVTAGAGLGYARFSTGLHTLAITTEGSLGFVQRGRPGGPGLLVEAGLRLDQLEELNAGPGSELDGYGVINVQLPFVRAGVTWR